MKTQRKLLTLIATMALGVAPAVAFAADHSNHPTGPPTNHGTAHKPSTPGPNSSPSAKAKAYGKNCQDQSKTHVAGTHGTPISKSVDDMAKTESGKTDTSQTDTRTTHTQA